MSTFQYLFKYLPKQQKNQVGLHDNLSVSLAYRWKAGISNSSHDCTNFFSFSILMPSFISCSGADCFRGNKSLARILWSRLLLCLKAVRSFFFAARSNIHKRYKIFESNTSHLISLEIAHANEIQKVLLFGCIYHKAFLSMYYWYFQMSFECSSAFLSYRITMVELFCRTRLPLRKLFDTEFRTVLLFMIFV